ncbi:MAG: rhombotarget lipoprotein [Chromatiales bacterium]|nr:MAG: rhombotarget lipoprotein [Chromatiales bacterium]
MTSAREKAVSGIYRITLFACLFACLFAAGGCSWMFGNPGQAETRQGVSSSLVDYLYPKGEKPAELEPGTPRLELPLRVGIAFVPAASASSQVLSEATKTELLNEVRSAFIDREYIQHIEVIPETYLSANSGLSGMQQVARLYGVDVMALVSYDQVVATDDTQASILYWTIVGAYFIPATENEVQTFVDTAVFDVRTGTLLFRAPGTDKRQSQTTAVQSMEQMREDRTGGFAAAMGDMTSNLSTELTRFEDRLEEEPQLADVQWQEGSRGGGVGSLGCELLLLLLLAGAATSRRAAAARS